MATTAYLLSPTSAATGAKPEAAAAAAVPPPAQTERLIAHEWGTFTSFSGSNGVPVGFSPNNTDLPITEICFAVGYNNVSNFNRQFLAQKGMPPSRFRALLAENTRAAEAA